MLRLPGFPSLPSLRLLTGCLLGSIALRAADLYVSPAGNDRNPGTQEAPVQTLAKIQGLEREHAATGVTVHLLPGIYRQERTLAFDARDSGTAEHPVVWEAADAASTLVTGGPEVPAALCRRLADNDPIHTRLSPELRDPVYVIDLAEVGIDDPGEFGPRGFSRPYRVAPVELFIGDHALHPAQWPKRGQPGVQIQKVIDSGSIPRNGDHSNRPAVIAYANPRIDRWAAARDWWLQGYFSNGYADDTIKVARLDTSARTITTDGPTMYGFQGGEPWQVWHAINLLEELSEPGEYYADPATKRLYFIPPTGVELAHARIRLSQLTTPLVAFAGVSHFRCSRITFEDGRGMGAYIERGEDVSFQHCTFRDLGLVGVCIGQGVAPYPTLQYSGESTPASRELGSLIQYLYAHSAFNRSAGRGHSLVDCAIYNTGAGGVSLGGGDRRTLTAAGNRVEGCDLHDFNRLDLAYRAGVNVDGVGNIISGNRIHEAPGSAVYVHGNDHLIENNEIYHCIREVEDMGAIYMGRDPSEQGIRIVRNFFHDNGVVRGPIGTQCVYLDDGASGILVAENLFYRNIGDALKVHNGFDNRFEKNVFIETGGIYCNEGDDKAAWLKEESTPLMIERLHKAVDVLAPPYSVRYPALAHALGGPALPGDNVFRWNVFIRSGHLGADGTRKGAFITEEGNRYEDEGLR